MRTADTLAAILADQVMGWKVGPDRFTMAGRRWMPRWKFQPTVRMEDAMTEGPGGPSRIFRERY